MGWDGSLLHREDAWAWLITVEMKFLRLLRYIWSGLIKERKNKTLDPSEWVMDRMKKFSKFMRVDITDHKEEAMCLFMAIEA